MNAVVTQTLVVILWTLALVVPTARAQDLPLDPEEEASNTAGDGAKESSSELEEKAPSSAPAPSSASAPSSAPAALDDETSEPKKSLKKTLPPERLEAPKKRRIEKEGRVKLRIDRSKERAFAACASRASSQSTDEVKECLQRIYSGEGDTTGDFQARVLLRFLSEHPSKEETEGTGMKGLVAVSGIYGLWAGIAATSALASEGLLPDNEFAILMGGVLSLSAGAGAAVGGYFLGERLSFTAADSRLVASGLVFGTAWGTAWVPTINDLFQQNDHAFAASLMSVVGIGALGGGAATLLATRTELTLAEVSLINTGNWIGVFTGILGFVGVRPFFPVGERPNWVSSLTFMALAGGGTAAGALSSQLLDLAWSETLLIDAGAAFGAVASSSVVIYFIASGRFDQEPARIVVPTMFGAIAATTIASAVGAGIFLHKRRSASARLETHLAPDMNKRRLAIVPMVIVGKDNQPVMGLGLSY